MSTAIRVAILTTASALTLASIVHAQEVATGADETARREETIIITGTRAANRTVLDTAVPVDVISAEDLTKSGTTEINQALSIAVPSYNFPRPGLADGTDTVRPATLRGLAPDQTLVLVNSKRRHSAALVNVNGTVGRGSSAVDLNTIPPEAISAIEVLRDGASAQYGSDALAGVINLRLRDDREGGAVKVSYGQRITEYSVNVGAPPTGLPTGSIDDGNRSRNDGQVTTVGGWKGLPLGADGFLTVSGEYKIQERTERGGVDVRQQYPLVNGAFDPRENTIDRYNAWYGEPEIDQITVFANGGLPVGEGAELYGWGSYQTREAVSAGFYRRAVDARNIISIYPDGFLPLIAPEVTDLSAAVGLRWVFAGWDFDASVVYGTNRMEFTIENTLNRSLGPTSPTVFDAGGFEAGETTFNIGAVKAYDAGLAGPLSVAAGVEYRRNTYEIFAGEPNSYITGTFGGAGGAQVFPGFQPSNEVDADRDAVGAYVDVEAELTEKLLLSAALRLEDYSDFGSNLSSKLAARYDLTDGFGVRGSLSTGFRAPSLQQQFFTSTATNFINGVPFEIGTFPATSAVGVALGGEALEAETSTNASIGSVFSFNGGSLTVDAYRIEIKDRIVLSENITGADAVAALTAAGITSANGGRYFLNGVDSTTSGVDIVLTFGLDTEAAGDFDFTLGANFNTTEVDRLPSDFVSGNTRFVRFGRVNTLTFEEGTPEQKFTGSTDWSLGAFGTTLRATYYGDVLSPGTTAANDFVLTAKTLIDLEGRWNLGESFQFAVGADNILDEYPDALPVSLNTTGNTPFSNFSPFGRSGRFVYGRATYNF
jgi:iron complex outermembrane receptor protein